jgi:hypothetical protein
MSLVTQIRAHCRSGDADPGSSPELGLRAQQLTSAQFREALASRDVDAIDEITGAL